LLTFATKWRKGVLVPVKEQQWHGFGFADEYPANPAARMFKGTVNVSPSPRRGFAQLSQFAQKVGSLHKKSSVLYLQRVCGAGPVFS
jgi:hypothetical protein